MVADLPYCTFCWHRSLNYLSCYGHWRRFRVATMHDCVRSGPCIDPTTLGCVQRLKRLISFRKRASLAFLASLLQGSTTTGSAQTDAVVWRHQHGRANTSQGCSVPELQMRPHISISSTPHTFVVIQHKHLRWVHVMCADPLHRAARRPSNVASSASEFVTVAA